MHPGILQEKHNYTTVSQIKLTNVCAKRKTKIDTNEIGRESPLEKVKAKRSKLITHLNESYALKYNNIS